MSLRWWLSFADKTGNLGVVICDGLDIVSAVRLAARLGINPGGEVMGFPLPDDIAPRIQNRRLTVSEVKEFGGSKDDPEYEAAVEKFGTLICECCGKKECGA